VLRRLTIRFAPPASALDNALGNEQLAPAQKVLFVCLMQRFLNANVVCICNFDGHAYGHVACFYCTQQALFAFCQEPSNAPHVLKRKASLFSDLRIAIAALLHTADVVQKVYSTMCPSGAVLYETFDHAVFWRGFDDEGRYLCFTEFFKSFQPSLAAYEVIVSFFATVISGDRNGLLESENRNVVD
jgi:hypothetical protein